MGKIFLSLVSQRILIELAYSSVVFDIQKLTHITKFGGQESILARQNKSSLKTSLETASTHSGLPEPFSEVSTSKLRTPERYF